MKPKFVIMDLEYFVGICLFMTRLDFCQCTKNVLLVISDDARPALGCYGDTKLITPNLDQLASKSVLFENAYTQQALCAPSRASFLTSRRPDTTKVIDNHHYWRRSSGNFSTLPQHFKNHGYHTVSVGKVFHPGPASGKTEDYPYSWSEKPYLPSSEAYRMAKLCPSFGGKLQNNIVCPVNVSRMPLKTLPDIQSTRFATDFLRRWKQRQTKQPFFLAVGYHKPHIPLRYPEKYKKLYPLSEIHLARHHTRPSKMPPVAWNPWEDLRRRDDVKELNVSFPYGPLPLHYQLLARQSYYACMSYVDDLIGQLLSTLDDQGFADNTIILMMSDHGWALGENQEWAKYSLFEVATRVPLTVYVPGLTTPTSKPGTTFPYINPLRKNFIKKHRESTLFFDPKSFFNLNKTEQRRGGLHKPLESLCNPGECGKHTDALVELVDVFPTLADLADVPIPKLCPRRSSSVTLCTEGASFADVVRNVSRSRTRVKWKRAVFSQYQRPSDFPQNNSDSCRLRDARVMGYTIRTRRYRYTEWLGFNHDRFKSNWSDIHARELYDQKYDVDDFNNVVDDPNYKRIVGQLSDWLKKGWRHAMPP